MNEEKHIKPADIETTSMGIIEQELNSRGITLSSDNAPIIKRVIHTTADFDYAHTLTFLNNPIKRACLVLKDKPIIVTDTNMAFSGINNFALTKLSGEKFCYMSLPEVADKAKSRGTTRATVSMEMALEEHPNAILAIGNAPTALFKITELIKAGAHPSLIIGVPVGFVNVVESKEELKNVCEEYNIPAIIAMGRKGGSNVAAAICNALLYMATNSLDPNNRGW